MKQASDEEVKAELANGPIENIIKSYYADFVEINIRARADAGIKQMIIREALGGCCEWCQKLVGIYEYGKHPKDIFKRHDNCTCLVTFKDEEGYTDVWSKKKFETQREARIARIEQFERKEELLKKSNRNWSIARDEGKNCYDATPEWNAKKAEKQDGKVTEQNYLIIENELHYVDDVHILSGHTEEERKCLKEQADELRHLRILRPSIHRRAAERKIHLAGQKDSRIRQLPHPEKSKDCISPKILEIRKAEKRGHLRFCQQAAHDGIRR